MSGFLWCVQLDVVAALTVAVLVLREYRLMRAVRVLVRVGIGAASVMVIAAVSIILEQTLLGPSSPDAHIVGPAWIVLGGYAVAWTGLTVGAARINRTGTLYYVRIQPEGFANWHAKNRDMAKRESLRYIEVVPLVPFDVPPSGGVIDCRGPVPRARDELLAQLNADDDRTGYQIALDALWFFGLALGYQCVIPRETEVIDLGKSDRPSFTVALGDVVAEMKPGMSPSTRVRIVPRSWKDTPESGPKNLLVQAALTANSPTPLTLSVRHRILVTAVDENDEAVGCRVRPGRSYDRGAIAIEGAAAVWADALQQALHECYDDEVIYLAAACTKVLPFLTGYLLGHREDPEASDIAVCGQKGCYQRPCRNPWAYLRPLHYDLGTQQYYEVKVL